MALLPLTWKDPKLHQKQLAFRVCNRCLLENDEFLGECLAELIFPVVCESLLAVEQKALDLWVLPGHELDDQMPAQGGQPASNVSERQVVRDGQMMNERQRHREIRLAPLCQGRAFWIGETDVRARISQVDDQRGDVGNPLIPARHVIPIDRYRIGVHAEDSPRHLGQRARVLSIVAAPPSP